MLDLDSWQEIGETLKRNKLRTALTAFSVAWGIFMLMLLLGAGQGLSNGVKYQFRDDAMNSIWVWGGETSLPHAGLQPGREIRMRNEDLADVVSNVAGVDKWSARFGFWGGQQVSRGDKSATFDLRAVHPGYLYVERIRVATGRFINESDVEGGRKVAVIGGPVRDALFGREEPIGQEIAVNGISFRVVGTYDDEGGRGENEKVYVPISTGQRAFAGGSSRIMQMMVTTGEASLEESQAMAAEIRKRLAARLKFDENDPRAVRIGNNMENFQRFAAVTQGIRVFVWIIGIGTILAGIVGVSNIMMITVRERTREIGVRKALGATPRQIVAQVLQESVLVTGVAGYAGLVAGVGVLELMRRFGADSDFFRNPEVDFRVAVQATMVLIVAGTLAGYFPAWRAAAIRPVEALRDE